MTPGDDQIITLYYTHFITTDLLHFLRSVMYVLTMFSNVNDKYLYMNELHNDGSFLKRLLRTMFTVRLFICPLDVDWCYVTINGLLEDYSQWIIGHCKSNSVWWKRNSTSATICYTSRIQRLQWIMRKISSISDKIYCMIVGKIWTNDYKKLTISFKIDICHYDP